MYLLQRYRLRWAATVWSSKMCYKHFYILKQILWCKLLNLCHVIPCFQVCGWWKKIIKVKIWSRKQSQTLFYSPILVHLFSVSHINDFPSRVHAIDSVITNTTNMCLNNFVFAPIYATLVTDRSLPAAILVGKTRCTGNDVIACVAAARALLCLKTFKWLARIPYARKTSVLTFYLFSVCIGFKQVCEHASKLPMSCLVLTVYFYVSKFIWRRPHTDTWLIFLSTQYIVLSVRLTKQTAGHCFRIKKNYG